MKGIPAALFAVVALGLIPPAAAKPFQLAPWKDELFGYANILETQYDGDYLEVEYNRPRDLHARDTKVGLKVDPKYVSLDTQAVQAELAIDAGISTVKYVGVGRISGKAQVIVIFLHGLGTGRAAGVDDWIHGGNFNRLKNLMMRNDGVYLSPSFSDFGRKGTAEIKALILDQVGRSPGAPVILACASAGANICWRLLADSVTAPLLGGLVFLDADMNDGYVRKAAALDSSKRVPIHISGSREDRVTGWKSQRQFFKDMKAAVPDYPIRYVLFSAGTHGLSLRMTDWRVTLNWLLATDRGSN